MNGPKINVQDAQPPQKDVSWTQAYYGILTSTSLEYLIILQQLAISSPSPLDPPVAARRPLGVWKLAWPLSHAVLWFPSSLSTEIRGEDSNELERVVTKRVTKRTQSEVLYEVSHTNGSCGCAESPCSASRSSLLHFVRYLGKSKSLDFHHS